MQLKQFEFEININNYKSKEYKALYCFSTLLKLKNFFIAGSAE